MSRLEKEIRFFWIASSGARKALYGTVGAEQFPPRLDILSPGRDGIGRRLLNPLVARQAGDPRRLDEWAEMLDLLADGWGPASTRAAARRALSIRRRATPATVSWLPTAIRTDARTDARGAGETRDR